MGLTILDGKVIFMPRRLLLISLALILAALLWTPALAEVRALVYNATGENLHLVVNGRMHLAKADYQASVFRSGSKDGLFLETANTDGELLTAELEDGQAYVILFQESKGIFVLWTLEELNGRLDEVLTKLPGRCKAVVFNASGRPVNGLFQDRPFAINRALCLLLLPRAEEPEDLHFQVTSPTAFESGLVADRSHSVLIYRREEARLVLLTFEDWSEELRATLEPE